MRNAATAADALRIVWTLPFNIEGFTVAVWTRRNLVTLYVRDGQVE
jgi:hypothetical protein